MGPRQIKDDHPPTSPRLLFSERVRKLRVDLKSVLRAGAKGKASGEERKDKGVNTHFGEHKHPPQGDRLEWPISMQKEGEETGGDVSFCVLREKKEDAQKCF
ncbi:hypothetical protein L596_029858 [Steinernema carpocapsae]|uniref:Uncharacterized protein n=1 Tax=Steinernema carpocapsae TaxID=34508 RepID=A0A4U5LR08_STECR|nr:hypothetical protein L596_029858 [Steinernema carpocapsae]